MKKGVFLLVLIMLLSFTSAFSINVTSVAIKNESGIDEPLTGTFHLELQDISANAIIKSELGEYPLREFLKSNNQPFACETFSCTDSLATTNNGEISKQITATPTEKIFGLVTTGKGSSAQNFTIGLSSTFSEKDQIPLTIQVGSYVWKYEKPSTDFNNPKAVTYGCFNQTASHIESLISSAPYCEKINLTSSKSYLLGANISGSGVADFVMTLKDSFLQDIASCNFSRQFPTSYTDQSNCTIKFENSIESGEYYVCIKSLAETSSYNLKRENTGTNCGFYNSIVPGLINDYSIYVKTPKYASSSGSIELSPEFKQMSANAINSYIQSRYSSDCSNGCVMPLKIIGDNISLAISSINLIYNSLDGATIANKIYETASETTKTGFDGTLALEKLDWKFASNGQKNITIYINDDGEEKKVLNATVFIKQLPIISGIYPTSLPAGIPITFYANIQNKGNFSNYNWDFGDNTTLITNTSYAIHTYENISSYNLTLTFGSGNYIASKSFSVETISPESYLDTTIASKKTNLEQFNSELSGFSAFIKSYFTTLINPSSYQTALDGIETVRVVTFASEEFLKIAKDLVQIKVPASIKSSNKKTAELIYNYNLIDPSIIAKITSEDITSTEPYKQKILAWQIKNIDSKITREEITVLNEDNSIRNLITSYKIELGSKSENKSYFVIQENPNKLTIESGAQTANIEDRATVIELDGGNKLTFSFLINGSANPIMFISPSLNELPVPKADPNCNKDSVCDSNENYKTCRNDCYPIWPTIIWTLVVLILIIIIYTILQVLYKIRYENYLFRNRNDLFNLISFINNAHIKTTSDKEITKTLASQGWSEEQITYALRKAEGKNSGMFEIIPIERILAHSEKKKAEEVKNRQISTPKPLKQNYQNQFRR